MSGCSILPNLYSMPLTEVFMMMEYKIFGRTCLHANLCAPIHSIIMRKVSYLRSIMICQSSANICHRSPVICQESVLSPNDHSRKYFCLGRACTFLGPKELLIFYILTINQSYDGKKKKYTSS